MSEFCKVWVCIYLGGNEWMCVCLCTLMCG